MASDKVCPVCKAPPGWHWWCKLLRRDGKARNEAAVYEIADFLHDNVDEIEKASR